MRRRRTVHFSVALLPEELGQLTALQRAIGAASAGDALRCLVHSHHGFFDLPLYQVNRLRAEATARGLGPVAYLREVLAQRYEELSRHDGASHPAQEPGGAR